jgi:hypothetical protein
VRHPYLLTAVGPVLAAFALAVPAATAMPPATVVHRTAAPTTAVHRTAALAPMTTRPVPQGFVGVDVDGPVTAVNTNINLADQMRAMVAAGVQTIRVAFNWAAAEPVPELADIPVAQRAQYTVVRGVPFDFSQTDAIVTDAARLHLTVLPTILYAPDWDGVKNPSGVDFPRSPGPYAEYAAALVARYGPHGSFWSANPSIPKVPITEWQIWNEPDLDYYWRQPFEAGYTALLRAAHASIKRADPSAKVVLGSLTNRAWVALTQLERRPGFSQLFDIAAVNAFTKLPAHVILYMRYVRRALDRSGNRFTPLLATELSFPSAVGRSRGSYDFDVTQAGQARDIAALLPMIDANYRSLDIAGFDYYTWMSAQADDAPPFDFAGLLAAENGRVHAKPALAAYRKGVLALEGCASQGPLATDCRH